MLAEHAVFGAKAYWVNVYAEGVGCVPHPCRSDAVYWGDNAVCRLKVRPWIPHDGGPCPVGPHVWVRVRLGDGWVSARPRVAWSCGCLGEFWEWSAPPSRLGIIAYQIMDD